MILADKIIELRKKSGMTQDELAEKLGVSRQSVSKWEGAQSTPDLARILKLAEIFSVSTDVLLKDELELEQNISTENIKTEKKKLSENRKKTHSDGRIKELKKVNPLYLLDELTF